MNDKNTYIIDIDLTILRAPHNREFDVYDYVNAEPIVKVINKLNKLYNEGHLIILSTARGMRTFKGDVKAIEEYHRPILIEWLNKHNVLYHRLEFGKSWDYGTLFYVDDRSLTINQFVNADSNDHDHFSTNNRNKI
jgi:capsule biosynthesis phosphatase